MCSLSWFFEPQGYHLFFNRDEQRKRAHALPAQRVHVNQVSCIMPIDPQGAGTWITTNSFGLSLCLLNLYQSISAPTQAKSRGLILKSLAAARSCDEVWHALDKLNLNDYAGFSLFVFEPQRVTGLAWDGIVLEPIPNISSPYISSSVYFEQAKLARQNAYERLISLPNQVLTHSDSNQAVAQHFNYHRSHLPNKGALSVCMHREDACSVSFTHIQVSQDQSVMNYYPGSPCQGNLPHTHRLELTKQGSITTQAPSYI